MDIHFKKAGSKNILLINIPYFIGIFFVNMYEYLIVLKKMMKYEENYFFRDAAVDFSSTRIQPEKQGKGKS